MDYQDLYGLFTVKNSSLVYQKSDFRAAAYNWLGQRNGEFHHDREMIGTCRIADALALKLADARRDEDVINGNLWQADAGGPSRQIREEHEVALAGEGLRHA